VFDDDPTPPPPAQTDVAAAGADRTDAPRAAVVHASANPGAASDEASPDLDGIERDLDAVDAALGRLADGTYWTDEVTGQPVPDDVLAADPTARRA
jgi:RNA polymerase-binding transcription factor DksA